MASGLMKAAGKTSLDLPMAALAAASVGFVMFAMPDTTLSALVSGSGLPKLIAAAEPPLGANARLVAVALAAIGAFLLVWLGLRALGDQPPAAKPATAKPEPDARRETGGRKRSFGAPAELEAPRIRRADAHPDAPSRRPLFAGSDLGEPLDDIDLSQDASGDEWLDGTAGDEASWPEPLPSFITDAPATSDYAPFEAEAVEQDAEIEPEYAPGIAETFEPQPYRPMAPAEDEEPIEASQDYEEVAEPVAEFPEPTVVAAPAAVEWIEQFDDEPQSDQEDASIADLMHRLERGLDRRERVMPGEASGTPPAGQVDGPVTGEDGVPLGSGPGRIDDRLRSALDDLQKMASRNGQA